MWSATWPTKILMILCMPERVSGGDAKFQGFYGRWNKWEGQSEMNASLAYLGGEHWTEVVQPETNRPVANIVASFEQNIFDLAQ